MGRDWRMDISDRNTALIIDGPFARIRHPIYAFSIAMMVATAIVLPTRTARLNPMEASNGEPERAEVRDMPGANQMIAVGGYA